MRIWLLRTASSVIKDLCCDVILVITVADCRRQELRDSVWDLEGVGGFIDLLPLSLLIHSDLTHLHTWTMCRRRMCECRRDRDVR